jgi:hypothetical protein
MKNLISIFAIFLLAQSCQDNTTSSNKRETSSIILHDEDIIDTKFEEWEGGTLESEKNIHQQIIDFSIQMLQKNKHKYEKIPRDAHAKSHGCLKATFTVDNKYLPKEYQKGLFSQNKSYNAYIRYSNNDHLPMRKDGKLDLRGMAIKIMGVEGKKIMKDYQYETTQDFLMYGSKVFFIKDNADYVGFIKGLRDDNAAFSLATQQPRAALKTLEAQFKIRNKINPLEIDYFSATPIRLGDLSDNERSAAKYSAKPCSNLQVKNTSKKKAHDYMRDNLYSSLEFHKKGCFDFQIQPQKFPSVMPIEDSTKRWPENRKMNRRKFQPYVNVAKIEFDYATNKNMNSKEMRNFCDDLSFSPWHTLEAHKPLGRTMRMRRDVYRAISDFRRSNNGANFKEPSE